MNILVLGGRGFIGKRLVDCLIKNIKYVDVVSRSTQKLVPIQQCRPKLIKCDLLDNNYDFETLVGKYDVIFNCAGELHDKTLMYSLHVQATERLVRACKKASKAFNRPIHWVQLSSVGAYGPSKPRPNSKRVVTEKTTPAPIGEYELTKTLADKLIVDEADDFFTFSILRPANVYGSDMPNNSIRQLALMIKKRLFFYVGKPGAISNYVHVDDVVDALVLCGFDSRAKGQVFNLSNDCDQTVVVNALAKNVGAPSPSLRLNESLARFCALAFFWVPKFPLKKSRIDALVNRTNYESQKIERILEFKPSRNVKTTIAEVLNVD